MHHFEVAIIGGGPAGSTAAGTLAKKGINTCLIEKEKFPRNVLCGEFLSEQVIKNIEDLGLKEAFFSCNPHKITNFNLYASGGAHINAKIKFEAYALKRSVLDNLLLKNAADNNCTLYQPAKVISIINYGNHYQVNFVRDGIEESVLANFIIASWGKQNILDKSFDRVCAEAKTDYFAVKYFVNKKYLKNFNDNEIRIYTAGNIYCGINSVSDDEVTLCYLQKTSDGLAKSKWAEHLYLNNKKFRELFIGDLKEILGNLKPYGTGNLYFGKKEIYFKRIFFVGDAGGLIAPFAGDGISMAMESGKLAGEFLSEICDKNYSINSEIHYYKKSWYRRFNKRLKYAAFIQKVLLGSFGNLFILVGSKSKFMVRLIMNLTR